MVHFSENVGINPGPTNTKKVLGEQKIGKS